MKTPRIKGIIRRTRALLKNDPSRFLRHVSGVIHVGANTGQEIDLYQAYDLRVVWVEPIPEIFDTLKTNIKDIKKHVALQCLVTDQDDIEYAFHVSNRGGQASSILELKEHKDIWPHVDFDRTIPLRSATLATLLKREGINVSEYDALVLDTQGAELLVLTGAVPILNAFKFIKVEVPDFEAYTGCCQLKDVEAFVQQHGFSEISRKKFAERAEGGSYYDIIYEKKG